MTTKVNYTKAEHYIPKTYLKGFAENSFLTDNLSIWVFDLKKMSQIPHKNTISDICQKKNLYELRDEHGQIIARNMIENTFERIETQIGAVIKSIIAKSEDEINSNYVNILSNEDKELLTILITMLNFRGPNTIESGQKYLKERFPDISENDARNFTLLNLLPLGVNEKWDENTIIRSALKKYSGMEFQIGITNDNIIFTSDNPVVEWPSKADPESQPKAVMFPLTSKMVLYMFPPEACPPQARNCFFELTSNQAESIQHDVAVYAKKYIFSQKPLTNKEIEIIKRAKT